MSFKETLTAAKAAQFTVVDGGFLLDEAHLNNIEEVLIKASAGTEAISQAMQTAEALDKAVQNTATLTAALNSATTEASEAKATLAALQAEIAAENAKPSGAGTTIPTSGDASVDEKKVPAYLDANSPENKWFDEQAKYR